MRDKMSVHYQSSTPEWSTPQSLFDELNIVHAFTLDPCATQENAKCEKFYSQSDDGLSKKWSPESVFMNPPYGRQIGLWVKKAYEESLLGALAVCLIPARTDTAWWHDYVMRGSVTFIRGRLKFGKGKNDAPFPSAIVIFGSRG